MSKIITLEQARELFDYSADTGVVSWKKCTATWVRRGAVAGHRDSHGYITIRVRGVGYRAHRIAWLLANGIWPEGDIDHINGDRLDNRLANLRVVSRQGNQQNMRRAPSSNKSTGLLGVSKSGPKFRANIRIDGSRKYLGTFDTAEAAHACYVAAKRLLHPTCTL